MAGAGGAAVHAHERLVILDEAAIAVAAVVAVAVGIVLLVAARQSEQLLNGEGVLVGEGAAGSAAASRRCRLLTLRSVLVSQCGCGGRGRRHGRVTEVVDHGAGVHGGYLSRCTAARFASTLP